MYYFILLYFKSILMTPLLIVENMKQINLFPGAEVA